VEREVVSLWLGTTGKLDRVPVGDVRRFEAEFLDFINLGHKGIFDSIRQTRALDDETVAGLESAVQAFLGQFTTAEGESLLDDEQVEPMDAADRGQERVQVKKSD
jgi:F-type H+-transporting ATPase subunit alpha